MIKKIRIKFIVVTLGMLTVLTLLIGGVFFTVNRLRLRSDAYTTLEKLSQIPSDNRPAEPHEGRDLARREDNMRTFLVIKTASGENISFSYDEGFYEESEIASLAEQALTSGKSRGRTGGVFYLVTQNGEHTVICGIDKSIELETYSQWLRGSIIGGSVAFVLLGMIIFLLSYPVVKPAKEALEKQKRFISDARHELKTPITVISANVDVLSAKIGENKWLSNIKSQAERLNVLANDLLQLAQAEENPAIEQQNFNLSQTVLNSALPFESVAYENAKNFVMDIADGIEYRGDQNAVQQAVTILMDNAIKHSDDNASIKLSLKSNAHHPVLEVYNTAKGVKPEDNTKLFERFYRGDPSRNRETGGSGLGLSILKESANRQGWKIEVKSVENSHITFTIIF